MAMKRAIRSGSGRNFYTAVLKNFGLPQQDITGLTRNPLSNFIQLITEAYRSGHNGADSKSVCEQSHMGSNPILSANGTLENPVFSRVFSIFKIFFTVFFITFTAFFGVFYA